MATILKEAMALRSSTRTDAAHPASVLFHFGWLLRVCICHALGVSSGGRDAEAALMDDSAVARWCTPTLVLLSVPTLVVLVVLPLPLLRVVGAAAAAAGPSSVAAAGSGGGVADALVAAAAVSLADAATAVPSPLPASSIAPHPAALYTVATTAVLDRCRAGSVCTVGGDSAIMHDIGFAAWSVRADWVGLGCEMPGA